MSANGKSFSSDNLNFSNDSRFVFFVVDSFADVTSTEFVYGAIGQAPGQYPISRRHSASSEESEWPELQACSSTQLDWAFYEFATQFPHPLAEVCCGEEPVYSPVSGRTCCRFVVLIYQLIEPQSVDQVCLVPDAVVPRACFANAIAELQRVPSFLSDGALLGLRRLRENAYERCAFCWSGSRPASFLWSCFHRVCRRCAGDCSFFECPRCADRFGQHLGLL